MSFRPEPALKPGTTEKLGILLVNLGTPDAPTAKAVRPYLRQFLSDPRVVEIPRIVWWPILNGIILTLRPKKSAEKYATIWTPDGSPLALHTRALAKYLQGLVGEQLKNRPEAVPVVVHWAMTYGQPTVSDQIQALKAQGCERQLIVPLYPQYASSSTGSAMDAVANAIKSMRNPPEIRFIKHFHDHPAYIAALVARIESHWQKHGRGDHLLMSFHGIPKISIDKGDPYQDECLTTARLLVAALGLKPEAFTVAFQSRFGPAEWLQPYASDKLHELGANKVAKLDVICPGFFADCLETLEEIATEGKEEFQAAGGGDYRYIPALNAESDAVRALWQVIAPHLGGWWRQMAPDTMAGRPVRE